MAIEAKQIPELLPPAVFFPYAKMGQSASGIDCDMTGGKFGPFANQLFVGDNSASTVMRVVLEMVNGRYQGACIPFRQGFASGNVPLRFAPEEALRRRHQPRLGLARHQAVRPRAARLDRQGAVRDREMHAVPTASS